MEIDFKPEINDINRIICQPSRSYIWKLLADNNLNRELC